MEKQEGIEADMKFVWTRGPANKMIRRRTWVQEQKGKEDCHKLVTVRRITGCKHKASVNQRHLGQHSCIRKKT
jgi:hypothetical protein